MGASRTGKPILVPVNWFKTLELVQIEQALHAIYRQRTLNLGLCAFLRPLFSIEPGRTIEFNRATLGHETFCRQPHRSLPKARPSAPAQTRVDGVPLARN